MSVLFVDHDGVLNGTEEVTKAFGFFKVSPHLVERLNGLLDRAPDVRIVLSTSWRTEGRWLECCTEVGFRHAYRIIGETDHIRSTKRADEIQIWLDQHPDVTVLFAILDDEDLGDQFGSRHIRTDERTGLTEANVERVLLALKGSSEW